jgi:hypothetical protein
MTLSNMLIGMTVLAVAGGVLVPMVLLARRSDGPGYFARVFLAGLAVLGAVALMELEFELIAL